MTAAGVLAALDLGGAAYAAPVTGGAGCGFHVDDPVSPASVMKIQIALTVENAMAAGFLDGTERRLLTADRRTAGPVGISLLHDDVSMSVRDLVVAMLTVSDNAATDELLAVVGLDAVNGTTRALGMETTEIVSTVAGMLDAIAVAVGFPDYAALVAHDPDIDGPPSEEVLRRLLAASAPLDPAVGNRTTAVETVALLQAIWCDHAGPETACEAVRRAMGQQLTRQRLASAFGPSVTVAAKSGGLLGVVRNEAGVVTFPDGAAYAVAVFTRREPGNSCEPGAVDHAIGRVARLLVDQLRGT